MLHEMNSRAQVLQCYLGEVEGSCPHLLPGLVHQLYADAVEFLECMVVCEKYRIIYLTFVGRYHANSNTRLNCVHFKASTNMHTHTLAPIFFI